MYGSDYRNLSLWRRKRLSEFKPMEKKENFLNEVGILGGDDQSE